jgi:hypothetical protein
VRLDRHDVIQHVADTEAQDAVLAQEHAELAGVQMVAVIRHGRVFGSYLPLAIERQPFLIGIGGEELMVHVDLDSPRISSTEGEAVFLPHGGTTEFLEQMNSALLTIHQGLQATPAFISALLALELLESFVFDIELEDGSQNRLAGFYTINEDRLGALGGDALERLHRAGHLQAVYMAIASLSHFRDLIERKNRLHAGSR